MDLIEEVFLLTHNKKSIIARDLDFRLNSNNRDPRTLCDLFTAYDFGQSIAEGTRRSHWINS